MSEPLDSRRKIGGYEILRGLKSGGMGQVWLARRTGVHGFEKLVAIKTIRSDHTSENNFRTMFLDEARLMARLNHPGIGQVHDFGEEGDTLYLVMEYVAGVAFSDLIKKKVPPGVAVRAVAEVCSALHAAHELTDVSGTFQGVIHRDISPENLMLNFDGKIKILDFGIALMRGRETVATQMGQVKGKPAYMSPEQVKGNSIDRRTDIFSLSIVLYELLTGRRLFSGDSMYSVALQISDARIEPPSHFDEGISSELDELVMRGLRRNPEDRFSTALDMAEAINELPEAVTGIGLQQYVAKELSKEIADHQVLLKEALQGSQGRDGVSVGRPHGVGTMPVTSPAGLAHHDNGEPGPNTVSLKKSPIKHEAEEGLPNSDSTAAHPLKLTMKTGVVFGLVLVFVAGTVMWFLNRSPAGSFEETPGSSSPREIEDPKETTSSVPVAEEQPQMEPATADQTGDIAVDAKENGSWDDKTIRPKSSAVKTTQPKKTVRPIGTPNRKESESENPPSPGGYGLVTLVAHPYANVKIDGKHVGATPIFKYKLRVGDHKIDFLNPEDDSIRSTQVIQVKPDSHLRISGK